MQSICLVCIVGSEDCHLILTLMLLYKILIYVFRHLSKIICFKASYIALILTGTFSKAFFWGGKKSNFLLLNFPYLTGFLGYIPLIRQWNIMGFINPMLRPFSLGLHSGIS